ncbi:hypothetical protein [Streptomyces sp. NPDC005096]|uniref:hypothetical protein n=1 Tax=Streptomyces sp. NPDC005096 TaxID=3154559 RepID=UPI0033AB8CBF
MGVGAANCPWPDTHAISTQPPPDHRRPCAAPGQTPEKVTFAHHLRMEGKEVKPGDTAHVSPEYARRLRSSGYEASICPYQRLPPPCANTCPVR